jgi:hypothetical protein
MMKLAQLATTTRQLTEDTHDNGDITMYIREEMKVEGRHGRG